MWRRLALAIALQFFAIALQGAGVGVQAEEKLPCEAFAKAGDGSWQALKTTFVPSRNFSIRQGSVWRPGATVLGLDIAGALDAQCPNTPIAAPASDDVSSPPPSPQLPAVSLAKYADANGNLDVHQLTCGHLADTSADEAEVLLAWYSGWYNGSTKKRVVNLPRVKFNARTVIDYCKVNRDKRLSDVMELMLK
jgi:hypothetical protein